MTLSNMIGSHGEQGTSASAVVPLRVGKKDPWQHVIDACTGFTQARIVNDRTTHSMLQGLQDIWIRPVGPP
eukprot:12929087-Prorocentrum_lima.AAC.1